MAGGQPEESAVASRQLPLNSLCGSRLPAVAGLQPRHKMTFKDSFPFGGLFAEPFLFLVFLVFLALLPHHRSKHLQLAGVSEGIPDGAADVYQ